MLDGKEYVYVWADGIYCNARLDDQKLCLLVIIGVTVDGKKELAECVNIVVAHRRGNYEIYKDIPRLDFKKSATTRLPHNEFKLF